MSWLRSSNSSASVCLPLGPSKTYDLVDLLPRQLAPLPAQLVPEPGELLFLGQERDALGDPLLVRRRREGSGWCCFWVAMPSSLGVWGGAIAPTP